MKYKLIFIKNKKEIKLNIKKSLKNKGTLETSTIKINQTSNKQEIWKKIGGKWKHKRFRKVITKDNQKLYGPFRPP